MNRNLSNFWMEVNTKISCVKSLIKFGNAIVCNKVTENVLGKFRFYWSAADDMLPPYAQHILFYVVPEHEPYYLSENRFRTR